MDQPLRIVARSSCWLRWIASVGCLTSFAACEAVLGLDDFTILKQTDGGLVSGLSCMTHSDCAVDPNSRCVRSLGRCATIRSEDCAVVAGPELDDDAIWIGMLAATSGPQRRANLARHASAVLAVDTINTSGGIPLHADATERHPLVLIACDSGRDLLRAANHLTRDLAVKAILGPDEGQDSVMLATKVAIPHDAVLIGPTATEGRLADLLDDDLLWSMVPSDQQRAPWLRKQLQVLETALRAERKRDDLRLAIAVPDDALGQNARTLLASLKFDGKPLTDPANLGVRVRTDSYRPNARDASALVEAYLEFAPDIVLIFGTTAAVTQILSPLESRWAAARANEPPPEYVLTDAAKVPELIDLVANNVPLRPRVRGVGATYTTNAREVHATFREAFVQRYAREFPDVSGLASTFDAVHAIAFAIAGTQKFPDAGRELAQGLKALSAGTMPAALRSDQVADDLARAAAGAPLRVLGSLAPLAWDDRGAPAAGALEVWCVSEQAGQFDFASSGLRTDLPSEPPELGAHGCDGPMVTRDRPATVGTPMSSAPAGSVPVTPPATPPSQPSTPPQREDAGPPTDMPMDASTPPTTPPATPTPTIPCGANACDPSQGEFCCVSMLRGLTADPQPQDLACARDRDDCAIALHCGGDRDCASGEVCCGITNKTECMPESACTSRAGTRFGCEGSRECPAGLVCCAHLAQGAATYERIGCETECGPTNQGILLCQRDEDCIGTPVTLACVPSRVIPNLKLCGLP